jgi:TolA-binding protein
LLNNSQAWRNATKKGLSILVLAAGVLSGCGKVESSGSPEELLREGWTHFRLQEFDAAEKAFRAALGKLPEGTMRLQAMYGLGMVASIGRAGGQSAAARGWFEQVARSDPTGDWGGWAALAIVRDRHVYGRADAAVLQAEYADVIAKFPSRPAAEEAFVYRCSLLVQTFEPTDAREAVREIAAWLQQHPGGKLNTALHALSSRAHETLGEYPAALAAAIASLQAKEVDPQNPHQNNILEYYRIGMMAQYDVGDFATARKYYQKFLKEYPRDQRAFNVSLMLRQLDLNETEIRAGKPVTNLSELGGTR